MVVNVQTVPVSHGGLWINRLGGMSSVLRPDSADRAAMPHFAGNVCLFFPVSSSLLPEWLRLRHPDLAADVQVSWGMSELNS